ncbi:MAG: hypothetical protein GX996_07850 [Firmicutes bacterium]|nr:hypothetical protein [Bacillota bacterium]
MSQFDVLVGQLLRSVYFAKPALLNSSESKLTVSEIFEYDSFDEVKNYFIGEEVTSLLRKSHPKQFDWLENKLSMELRKGLDIWPCFVEVTQRRSLLVHTDGICRQVVRLAFLTP